jgi:putative oxidoreductase
MDLTILRSQTARGVAIWVLSALLAIEFLIVGVQKLIPGQNYWLEAFSMWNYPPWFRIVVGTVETIGAVGLLIPRFALIAATALAIVMFGAMFTQLMSGGGGALTPALLFVLLVIVARWRQKQETRKAEP